MPAVWFASVCGVCFMNRGRSRPKTLRVSQWVGDGVKSAGFRVCGLLRRDWEAESVAWVEVGEGDGERRVGRGGPVGFGMVKVPGGGEGRRGGGGGGENGCDCNGCGCDCCCMRLMACPTGPYPPVRGCAAGCAGIIAGLRCMASA